VAIAWIGVIHLPARPLVVLGRVQQVLVQGLTINREALRPRSRDCRDPGRSRDVHHVECCTLDILGQPDYPIEREVLRQSVVHLSHILKTDAVLANQLLVHVHDDVVVLGVNCGDAALGREDLQYLPDIAKLHHPALPVGPDVGGEHLHRGMARLDRLRHCAEHALRQPAVQ